MKNCPICGKEQDRCACGYSTDSKREKELRSYKESRKPKMQKMFRMV